MALDATIVFEMRTTGAATNGGGYKPGATGTDFSQQAAAQYALTGATSAGAGASLSHASAAADMVGNVAYLSGTNITTGWYEIISVSAGVSITFDRSCATGVASNGVINVGGAISTFQDAFLETLTPGNKVWVKTGTYTLAENIDAAKDGTFDFPIVIEGYNATRGDAPLTTSRPVIAATTFTTTFDDYWQFKYLQMTHATTTGWKGDTGCMWYYCKVTATGTARPAITAGNGSTFDQAVIGCELTATGKGIGGSGSVTVIGCYIHDTGAEGVATTFVRAVINCIFDTTADNAVIASVDTMVIGCTFYNCLRGVSLGTSYGNVILNNIFDTCTTGISATASNDKNVRVIDYNNFHANTTARTNVPTGDHDTSLDPGFTDAANGDFRVGANMQAIGFPGGTFPGGLSATYMDLGAVQRKEDYPAEADVKSGTSYGNGSKTGTLPAATGGARMRGILGQYAVRGT